MNVGGEETISPVGYATTAKRLATNLGVMGFGASTDSVSDRIRALLCQEEVIMSNGDIFFVASFILIGQVQLLALHLRQKELRRRVEKLEGGSDTE